MFHPGGEKSWLEGFGCMEGPLQDELLHYLFAFCVWTPYAPLVAGVTMRPLTRYNTFASVGEVVLFTASQLSRLCTKKYISIASHTCAELFLISI